MTKKQLINSLYKQDLNSFTFTVWRKNNKGKVSFEYFLGNSRNEEYKDYIGKIGGNPDIRYTKRMIEIMLFIF